MKPFLLSLGFFFVVIWMLMPEYVVDRHELAAAGVSLLICWLGLSCYGDRRGRRMKVVRAAEARLVEEVHEDLAQARRMLPPSGAYGRVALFDDAILRGDLPSALAELEVLGLAAGATFVYWYVLAAAAGRMGLDEVRARLVRRAGDGDETEAAHHPAGT